MALSDKEQRLLEQLEAALAAEDPKLANTLRGTTTRTLHRRRAAIAGLGFVIGLAALIGGMQLSIAVSVIAIAESPHITPSSTQLDTGSIGRMALRSTGVYVPAIST